MNKVVINDFAPNAEKDAQFYISAPQSYGDLLNINARNLINYASFTGEGIDLYDGTLEFAVEGDNVGFLTENCSNSQRVISEDNVLSIRLDPNKKYSSPGITLYFWQNHFAEVKVKWWDDEDVLDEKTFYPDSLNYFIDNPVEGFNWIDIIFKKSEVPHQLIKLAGIDLGRTREITDFVSNIEIFAEINPDCADLPGSTCDFVAKVTDFKPQNMQELYVYAGKDEKLFGKFIIDRAPIIGKDIYSFECTDEIMRLQNSSFSEKRQGSYTVSELVEDIKEASNVNIDCGEYAENILNGFIEKDKTTRFAAAMISFATGTFLTGFGSKTLRFMKQKERKYKHISSSQILGKPEYTQIQQYTNITLNTYRGSFDTVYDSRSKENTQRRASAANNPLIYDRYSLITDIDLMFNRIVENGFEHDEITAKIIYQDEEPGDICAIETPYNGVKTGIIKNMNISIGHRITATIKMIKRNFASEESENNVYT